MDQRIMQFITFDNPRFCVIYERAIDHYIILRKTHNPGYALKKMRQFIREQVYEASR